MTRDYRTFLTLTVLMLAFMVTPVPAEERPVQLSLFAPAQVFPEQDNIVGIRLNLLYGRNVSVIGADLGLVNHTTSGVSQGWQTGLVGIVDADFVGWQDNSVNVVKGNLRGFQWGIFNYAVEARGFQLGFVNYAESMYGLQIGLVNMISRGSEFPILPLVNWSF